ncbi:MAG TPA: serine/threonine-protein kinase [Woeseiaceae bacterium]|nr:serine/threonine-protein kinase [Woeseiaceae bacterium]
MLVRLLGEGGMAFVWLARDIKLDLMVALKFLNKDLTKNKRSLDSFKREWEISSNLIHSNIVRVFEFHADMTFTPFYSMQYIKGPDLSVLCEGEISNSLKPFGLIADAIHYAHQREIIHGDIKASNIILNTEGNPFLLDFGIASAASDFTGFGKNINSFDQIQMADDIFSLGILMYEVIFGVPPNFEKALGSVIQKKVNQDLGLLVLSMLDPNPSMRPVAKDVKSLLKKAGFPANKASFIFEDELEFENEVIEADLLNKQNNNTENRVDIDNNTLEVNGISRKTFFISLCLILIVCFSVIFVLPETVNTDKEITKDLNAIPIVDPENNADVIDRTLQARKKADNMLANLLVEFNLLEDKGADKWANSIFQSVKNNYNYGDSAYLDGNYDSAFKFYETAFEESKKLSGRIDQELNINLEAGKNALDNNKYNDAIGHLDIVTSIEPNNLDYTHYYKRALNLEEVLNLNSQSAALLREGKFEYAREIILTALQFDSEFQPSKDLLQEIDASITRDRFEKRMSEGFIALGGLDFQSARVLFSDAKSLYPDSSEPIDAMLQLEQIENDILIAGLVENIKEYEETEQWEFAVASYQELLRIDKDMRFAKDGLFDASGRLELHNKLQAYIDDYDTLSDPQVMQQAIDLLVKVSVFEKKPRLASQAKELSRLLKRANTPIKVNLLSDNLTNVTVYRVGNLNFFAEKLLSLRPGQYVAVGARDGYRDVRIEFTVAPEIELKPIVIICEEPI